MRRVVVLGGTGAMGGAVAMRLAKRGWRADVTGRSPDRMPQELSDLGVQFHAWPERSDAKTLSRIIGDGVDLLVDLTAFTGAHVIETMSAYRDSRSVVVASSRAVYVDEEGRHINGDEPPQFPVPIPETNATLAPAGEGIDPYTRDGYGPSKVAMEQAALGSGLPVTVIRPSKVHGRSARNARTRTIVERMRRGADVIELARQGGSIDHLTAAANVAALVETLSDSPGSLVLNIADPDPLTSKQIVAAIAGAVGWRGRIVGLDDAAAGGENPWAAVNPIVLDTTSATALGYRPQATGRELLAEEATWVAREA